MKFKIEDRSKKWLATVLKLIVFGATLYYLYFKVIDTEKFQNFIPKFTSLSKGAVFLIIVVFAMMLLNWSIETIKWKLLISKIENISFLRSFIAVWSGLTINNWVPNRTAEFLGRIIYISPENRIKAISSTLAGNVAQLITMISIGSVSMVLWKFNIGSIESEMFLFVAGLLTVFLSAIYFNIGLVHKIFKRFRLLNKFEKYVDVLSSYTSVELTKVLMLSVFRLSIYVVQYYLLLAAFGIEIPFITALIGICSIFFIQSVLPAVTITEIGVRGATAVFILEMFTSDLNGVIAAAYSLWLINVIIPTIFGAIFIVIKKRQS